MYKDSTHPPQSTMLPGVYCLLVPNVLWDILSVYSLSTVDSSKPTNPKWNTRISTLYSNIWRLKEDDNRASRIVLAYFRAILCLMRVSALIDLRLSIIAITSYGWEAFWVVTGVLCGIMRPGHVIPTIILSGVGTAVLMGGNV